MARGLPVESGGAALLAIDMQDHSRLRIDRCQGARQTFPPVAAPKGRRVPNFQQRSAVVAGAPFRPSPQSARHPLASPGFEDGERFSDFGF
ncbi:MAG: hypothetical protein ABR970_16060, partial [Roseiarcus sp.]